MSRLASFGPFSVVAAFYPSPCSVHRKMQSYIDNKTLISIKIHEEIRRKEEKKDIPDAS